MVLVAPRRFYLFESVEVVVPKAVELLWAMPPANGKHLDTAVVVAVEQNELNVMYSRSTFFFRLRGNQPLHEKLVRAVTK